MRAFYEGKLSRFFPESHPITVNRDGLIYNVRPLHSFVLLCIDQSAIGQASIEYPYMLNTSNGLVLIAPNWFIDEHLER